VYENIHNIFYILILILFHLLLFFFLKNNYNHVCYIHNIYILINQYHILILFLFNVIFNSIINRAFKFNS